MVARTAVIPVSANQVSPRGSASITSPTRTQPREVTTSDVVSACRVLYWTVPLTKAVRLSDLKALFVSDVAGDAARRDQQTSRSCPPAVPFPVTFRDLTTPLARVLGVPRRCHNLRVYVDRQTSRERDAVGVPRLDSIAPTSLTILISLE